MYRHTFQDILEAEKGAKQKWVFFFKHPVVNRKTTANGGTQDIVTITTICTIARAAVITSTMVITAIMVLQSL